MKVNETDVEDWKKPRLELCIHNDGEWLDSVVYLVEPNFSVGYPISIHTRLEHNGVYITTIDTCEYQHILEYGLACYRLLILGAKYGVDIKYDGSDVSGEKLLEVKEVKKLKAEIKDVEKGV